MSSSVYVARVRYIQSIHEPDDRRNPDTLVGRFLTFFQRWKARRVGAAELAAFRQDPFYYYLLARTKYYDTVVSDAIASGVQHVVIVGSGGDTRPYRFSERPGPAPRFLECDQPKAIAAKQSLAQRWPHSGDVEYLALDLNAPPLRAFEAALKQRRGPTLVMVEGVSPYIEKAHWTRFVELLGATLSPGSHVAYDYKIEGINDELGRFGTTLTPFRLPTAVDEVRRYHADRGLRLQHVETSVELTERLVPGVYQSGAPPFREDVLLRLITE